MQLQLYDRLTSPQYGDQYDIYCTVQGGNELHAHPNPRLSAYLHICVCPTTHPIFNIDHNITDVQTRIAHGWYRIMCLLTLLVKNNNNQESCQKRKANGDGRHEIIGFQHTSNQRYDILWTASRKDRLQNFSHLTYGNLNG